jgi:hypothetical protein
VSGVLSERHKHALDSSAATNCFRAAAVIAALFVREARGADLVVVVEVVFVVIVVVVSDSYFSILIGLLNSRVMKTLCISLISVNIINSRLTFNCSCISGRCYTLRQY